VTRFEQELIKVLRHGCPKCGSKEWEAYRSQDVYSRVKATESGHLVHSDINRQLYYRIRVSCPDCHIDLWTKEHGWIDELKEVVEGD